MVTAEIVMVLACILVSYKAMPLIWAEDVKGLIIFSIFYLVVNLVLIVLNFVFFEKGNRIVFNWILGIVDIFYVFLFVFFYMTNSFSFVLATLMQMLVWAVVILGVPVLWSFYKVATGYDPPPWQ